MHNIGTVLAARTSSKRLPGKALLTLGGIPMIEFIINRIKGSNLGGQLIFATTNNKTDDYLAKFVENLCVHVFRGDENDLVKRYLDIAEKYSLEYLVRITGDCPFIDSFSLDYCLSQIDQKLDFDLWTTKNTFPTGLDFEVINCLSLQKAKKEMTVNEKEHLTLSFYNNQIEKKYIINNFKPPERWVNSSETFTVDTFDDYIKAIRIVERIGSVDFSIETLLKIHS